LCEYLEWDSQFFGLRICRFTQHRLTREASTAVRRWCESNRIDCLYFLADPGDGETASLAHGDRFQLVDVRVTLGCRPGHPEPAPAVRPFQPTDAARLRSIARVSHRHSRFYQDARFPKGRVDALYETWIDRSFSGWADTVLVAESEGVPAGYVSCHLAPPSSGSIGLVAVAQDYQRRGLGRQLIDASLEYFRQHGVERATVVTQGRNIDSQRLYQRSGFLTQSVQLWYHCWFGPEART
jgi:ribosomal protein S18 acetylase RimI-like enzyme